MLTINKETSQTSVGPRALKVLQARMKKVANRPFLLARFDIAIQNKPMNLLDMTFRFESLAALDEFSAFYCKKFVPHPKFARMWHNPDTSEMWLAVNATKADYDLPWAEIAATAA